MRHLFILLLSACLCFGSYVDAGKQTTRILLLGKERDHPFGTHEYMTDCEILAKCLQQTPGVEAIVSNGWPKDAGLVKDVKAIVLHTRNGGDVLFNNPFIRKQVDELLAKGVGITAIHWSTGADDKAGAQWLIHSGAWFSTGLFSKLHVGTERLIQADPNHPICRGWKEYDLRDEYYLNLAFNPNIKPVLKVEIKDVPHTVGWVLERPKTKGRSFGFVCGHFHANFGEPAFRRAIVNGILWTAHLEVPAEGAPVDIAPKDMELPPDTRKKK